MMLRMFSCIYWAYFMSSSKKKWLFISSSHFSFMTESLDILCLLIFVKFFTQLLVLLINCIFLSNLFTIIFSNHFPLCRLVPFLAQNDWFLFSFMVIISLSCALPCTNHYVFILKNYIWIILMALYMLL